MARRSLTGTAGSRAWTRRGRASNRSWRAASGGCPGGGDDARASPAAPPGELCTLASGAGRPPPPNARRDGRRTIRATAGRGHGAMTMPTEIMKVKICMAGEGAVGKTSLIRRYVLDQYDDRYIATLGTKITKKSVTVANPGGPDPLQADVILWDIMGTSTVRELLKEAYYHGA